MSGIIQPEVQQYIRNLLPPRTGIFKEMEQEARDKIIPIVEPEVGHLLYWLALTKQSCRVLEIGTAIGYSTLWLARAVLPRGGQITTMEINRPRFEAAQRYFKKAGVADKIKLILGDARELLFELTEPYDFIFLDAAKGKYIEFLDKCVELLQPGGIMVAEDVFMRGMVISGQIDKRRNKTAVTRLRSYLEMVMEHPKLETIIIPVGDGVTISTRK
ncbi:O-methyltransferase family 3 [Desulfotomaculum nigrificans CO-1-SRB]|uniref:tRNA 5-hydroxyuridine methyltransferase n=1 Tax=Desulfotomaculum nigrificans (strain DSM 14880 / VKM B-2319 / CO-1-SRB) TaxID=868595 RepID=F6B9X0_DESCC|nr:O-methyltransferase [Desulfotomaculum nigrificans]AEF93818.1 O-methyltransferase family 3 [Desulfotomaculum nigrificans CO-1-SRB]